MKVLVLGIGNILFGDEGIGVHLSNLLKLNYRFSSTKHSLDIIDGGTLAQGLIPLITSFDYVLLLDCINANGGNIGDVFFFDFAEIPQNINWQGSAHEVEMLQTLKMIEIFGDLPTIKILATIPEIINDDTAFLLSNQIKNAAMIMRDVALRHLREIGFDIQEIDNRDIQDIANYSFKGF